MYIKCKWDSFKCAKCVFEWMNELINYDFIQSHTKYFSN